MTLKVRTSTWSYYPAEGQFSNLLSLSCWKIYSIPLKIEGRIFFCPSKAQKQTTLSIPLKVDNYLLSYSIWRSGEQSTLSFCLKIGQTVYYLFLSGGRATISRFYPPKNWGYNLPHSSEGLRPDKSVVKKSLASLFSAMGSIWHTEIYFWGLLKTLDHQQANDRISQLRPSCHYLRLGQEWQPTDH